VSSTGSYGGSGSALGRTGAEIAAQPEEIHQPRVGEPFVIQWKPMQNGLNLFAKSAIPDPVRVRLSITGGQWFDEIHKRFVPVKEFAAFSGIGVVVDREMFCRDELSVLCVHGKKGDSQIRVQGLDPQQPRRNKQLQIQRNGRWQLDVRMSWVGSSGQKQIDTKLDFVWEPGDKPRAAGI
jgi:hypothetical protein